MKESAVLHIKGNQKRTLKKWYLNPNRKVIESHVETGRKSILE